MNHPPKYPSTPHWPWSPTVHKDDRVHSNPEFFLNKQVVITEKLDGGNTCLWNGNVYARSTSQPATQGWFAMVKKHHAFKTLVDKHYPRWIYGEDLYGVHSIEYDPMPEDKTFYPFAVRYITDNAPGPENDMFASWDVVEQEASIMGVETVPLVMVTRFDNVNEITETFEHYIQQTSLLGGECEGFVMRVFNKFEAKDFALNVCKYVRPNHVQTDEHWTKNWKPCKLT